MTATEKRVLERWPVLKIVKEKLAEEGEIHFNPRAWIWIYATIAARHGIHGRQIGKNEDSS